MALPDLTGQNVQDTYQRVLTVGDGGLMYDGTGSLFTPLSASHEVTTELSSSHADLADNITGQPSIYVTNITASGDISASSGTITSFSGSFHHLITDGNTIEFWMKKVDFAAAKTQKEVILDVHSTSSVSS